MTIMFDRLPFVRIPMFLFFPLAVGAVITAVVLLLVAIWRITKAQESIAGSLALLARKLGAEIPTPPGQPPAKPGEQPKQP